MRTHLSVSLCVSLAPDIRDTPSCNMWHTYLQALGQHNSSKLLGKMGIDWIQCDGLTQNQQYDSEV